MLSPTINRRFSQKDIFLIRKINEMRKPGNKIQVQKAISVVVQRKLTCASSSMLARMSNPTKKENSVFLPSVMTCCSEYSAKGLKGGLAGNAAWTAVDCSVIGTSAFHGKLGRGAVGASGNGVAATLNCGDPLSGDEPGAEW